VLSGQQVKNQFATQTDLVNIISFKAPTGGAAPVLYRIYRDASLSILAGTVPSNGPLITFQDHNRLPNRTYNYYIVSVDQTGAVSTIASISVPPAK